MKEARLIDRFSEKKFLIWGNGPFWANRWMRMILIVFKKKKKIEANGPFWAQKGASS